MSEWVSSGIVVEEAASRVEDKLQNLLMFFDNNCPDPNTVGLKMRELNAAIGEYYDAYKREEDRRTR